MELGLVLLISAVAAFTAHKLADAKGRNAVAWTWATALFPPALILLLLTPDTSHPGEAR